MTSLAMDRWDEAQARARNGVLSDAQGLHELLKADPRGIELLRALRTTEYHYVAERGDGEPPITGGHFAEFDQIRQDCEWMLGNLADAKASPWSRGPTGIRRVTIFDALGCAVWSKERADVMTGGAA